MKTTNENLTNNKGQIRYEAPRVNLQYVELEYGIAAGSVESNLKESWNTESQAQEQEWN